MPHKYRVRSAFFYPVFQLVDYSTAAGHSAGSGRRMRRCRRTCWCRSLRPLVATRRGAGPRRCESGCGSRPARTPATRGRRPRSLAHQGSGDLAAVIEFDPASFVLTAYSRINAGTIHGDRDCTAVPGGFLHLTHRPTGVGGIRRSDHGLMSAWCQGRRHGARISFVALAVRDEPPYVLRQGLGYSAGAEVRARW